MLESAIERVMCKAFAARGAICVKMQSSIVGLPDRLIVLPGGSVLWVQLKQENGRLSMVQKAVIRKLQNMGHTVRVVYGRQQAMSLVEEVMPNA